MSVAVVPPPEVRQDKMPKSLVRQIFIGIAAIVAVLAALELLFGFAGLGEEEFLRMDKQLGFAHMEGKHVTFRKEGFSRTKINSLGMRDVERTIAKPAGTIRVAVLGDSMVEALQVEQAQDFCALLEGKLNQAYPNHKFQVLNFGVSAYNLGQMYLQLKDQVLQFKPDLVVLPVRVDTTLLLAANPNGGLVYARPTFFVDENGKLLQDDTVLKLWQKTSEAKRMRTTAWLRQSSHVWGVYAQQMGGLISWWRAGHPWFNTACSTSENICGTPVLSRKSAGKATVYLWPVANALIRAMSNESVGHGAKFMLVRLPGNPGYVNDDETRLLQKTAANLNLSLVDLNDAFAKAQSSPSNSLFYVTHFTPLGHQVAADALFQAIAQDKLLTSEK